MRINVVLAVSLSGCSLVTPPVAGQYAALPPDAGSNKYRVVFELNRNKGEEPQSSLLLFGREFYTTGSRGGAHNAGSVFEATPNGTGHAVYSFRGARDGAEPESPLIGVRGQLYGTTYAGGGIYSSLCNSGCGTVFAISPSGKEHVLHRFGTQTDGASPAAGLLYYRGLLYGTTVAGGAHGQGAIFSLTLAGKERVLHSFGGTSSGGDGATPLSGLTEYQGALYGTTARGGQRGWGAVYKITPSGNESIVYSFAASPDGNYPTGGLTVVNGTLYGTTTYGGQLESGYCGGGCGTVYSVSTSGNERVIYTFNRYALHDGHNPQAVTLIYTNGLLYGTTSLGGQ